MKQYETICKKAEKFLYRNARPIELARWRYHFEGGTCEEVLTALTAFQNADGGFGHALEADSFNPNSSPVQVWTACEILREIGFEDRSHPIIKGILHYLDSGADFSAKKKQWLNAVSSNDAYPHAAWWDYNENQELKYNPTANLAGFILRFADAESRLYRKAEEIAKQAYEWFRQSVPTGDGAVAACFIRLYEYMEETGAELVDMREFADKLKEEVSADICREPERWGTEYVCHPSTLIDGKTSMFYEENEELVRKECELIAEEQLEDGSYHVPWLWYNDYPEYLLAANWWKSVMLIEKMRFLREFQAGAFDNR